MEEKKNSLVLIAGPTASGKSKEAVRIARERNGEVISVDSRQVYRGLDIGTEKIIKEEMLGVPHHLIDIREPNELYSAGDFVQDAKRLIDEIISREKVPILAGGTHFYFDALLFGLPQIPMNADLREQLEQLSTEELASEVEKKDPERFVQLDPHNRRRLIRVLEIIETHGHVPAREKHPATALSNAVFSNPRYHLEWIVLNPPKEELLPKIGSRLTHALAHGLVDEVRLVREKVGDARLNELGLEYRIVGEYLREEREEASLLPTLVSRLWNYARRQKAWLRKLEENFV